MKHEHLVMNPFSHCRSRQCVWWECLIKW